jgi:hypothetical protein
MVQEQIRFWRLRVGHTFFYSRRSVFSECAPPPPLPADGSLMPIPFADDGAAGEASPLSSPPYSGAHEQAPLRAGAGGRAMRWWSGPQRLSVDALLSETIIRFTASQVVLSPRCCPAPPRVAGWWMRCPRWLSIEKHMQRRNACTVFHQRSYRFAPDSQH